MTGLIGFMEQTWGRILRIVLGVVLLYVGLSLVGGTAGLIVAIVGLVPIIMGIWSPCLLGFVFRQPHRA